MLSTDETFRLAQFSFADLQRAASEVRDEISSAQITYCPHVMIPLETGSEDLANAYLSIEQILKMSIEAASLGACVARITLDRLTSLENPHSIAWLHANRFPTSNDYLAEASRTVLQGARLMPHINPGTVSDREFTLLKQFSVSQGLMLETIAGRLSEPGGPQFGSPDKLPARRLATLEAAGRSRIPFSTGVLCGIGETRHERIKTLLAIKDLHSRYGHIQEVVIQNAESDSGQYDEDDYLWTIAASRLIFDSTIHIQARPYRDVPLEKVVAAGIDDIGGIAANPKEDNPWKHLLEISNLLGERHLKARGATYPEFFQKAGFVDDQVQLIIAKHLNEAGYINKDPATIDIREAERSPSTSTYRKRSSNLPASKPSAS